MVGKGEAREYPWFGPVEGRELWQGDILEDCPVFAVPPSLDVETQLDTVPVDWRKYDLVVMSQSCDMDVAHPKIDEVLLCPVWLHSELTGAEPHPASLMENIRKGRRPALQVLNKCELAGLKRDYRVVDFHHVYSLPLGFLRAQAKRSGKRIRLLPPYREHLAQAFARFFMRVGLPVDIPSFTKPR